MNAASRRSIGRTTLVFDELASTNDYAADIINEPDAVGTVIRARTQTAGRGTFGRTWHSPRDAGVWMSTIVDPPEHLRRPVILTAWVAVSVAEAIRRLIGRHPRIKWPNDILLGGKKVAGILVEQKSRTIVGIGLNVNQTNDEFDQTGLPGATSLMLATGQRFDVERVADEIIDSLDREFDSILSGDLSTLESCWKWRVGLLGRRVNLECYDGQHVIGRLIEMAFDGLELRLQNGNSAKILPENVKLFASNGFRNSRKELV